MPLTLRAPFLPSAIQGTEVPDLVQLFDIVATTLELASIESKHVHFSRSLTPYARAPREWRGAVGSAQRRDAHAGMPLVIVASVSLLVGTGT